MKNHLLQWFVLVACVPMLACSSGNSGGKFGTGSDTADGTDGGSADGTDGGSVDGTDSGSADGTDGGSVDGTDGGSADGTDGGSADGTDGGSADGTDGGSGGGVTYHGTVRAILEVNCVKCHTANGIGPMPLDSYTAAKSASAAAEYMVTSKLMPPWMPDPDCHSMLDERVLSETEIQAVSDWALNGTPEGDPNDYEAPQTPPSRVDGEPDLLLDAGADYVADGNKTDDYRCLVLDHTFAKDTFVQALDIFPDATETVHHVLLYLVPEEQLSQLDALDSADPGPGYTCYGGPKVGQPGTLGGWVPGSVPSVYPKDSAIFLPKGSRVVMQVHYNLLGVGAGEVPPADRSKVALWTLPDGQKPTSLVNIVGFANGAISIPAGDEHSVQEKVFNVPAGMKTIGAGPHMHTLGKAIKVTLEHADGGSTCMVDIPQWDFNWQQFYQYTPGAHVTTQKGDKVKLVCIYDNSAQNQPYVDGVKQTPKHVTWGEGTLDEMCLNYLIFLTPFTPVVGGGDDCSALAPCIPACDEGDADCFLACLTKAGGKCSKCFLPESANCASAYCPTQMKALSTCLKDCDNVGKCLLTTCNSQFESVYSCFEPHLKAGECNDDLKSCGVFFGG